MGDPRSSSSSSGNVSEKAKKELHTVIDGQSHRDDTSDSNEVKSPNLLVRVKDEIDAIIGSMHPKKERQHSPNSSSSLSPSVQRDSGARTKNSNVHTSSDNHDQETHGLSCDFDENTPISAVKGPSVFERAKEEVEALIQTIHPKKKSG